VERNRFLDILRTDQHKKAGFYMRSKTAARDRLLGEDKPGVSCRLLDMRDNPALPGRLLDMRQASRKRLLYRYEGQTSRTRQASRSEGQANIKRQAFIRESDQQKQACF
jgi:hypothetical protein